MINFGILLIDHDRQIARDAFLTLECVNRTGLEDATSRL